MLSSRLWYCCQWWSDTMKSFASTVTWLLRSNSIRKKDLQRTIVSLATALVTLFQHQATIQSKTCNFRSRSVQHAHNNSTTTAKLTFQRICISPWVLPGSSGCCSTVYRCLYAPSRLFWSCFGRQLHQQKALILRCPTQASLARKDTRTHARLLARSLRAAGTFSNGHGACHDCHYGCYCYHCYHHHCYCCSQH